MAINAKVNFIFGGGKWGWTETYYWSANSGTVDNVMVGAVALAGKRAALLGTGSTLEAIRVSDTANKSNSLLNTNNTWTPFSQDAGSVGSPWQAALCNLQAIDTTNLVYTRKLLLRGMPHEWYNFTPSAPTNPILIAAFKTALNAFFQILTRTTQGNLTPWSIRASNRDRVANPTFVVQNPVTIVTPGAYFQLTVVGAGTAGWVVGQKIHVTGVKGPGMRGVNGDGWITAIAANQLTFSRQQNCPSTNASIEVAGKAYTRTGSYIYPIISLSNFERFVKRDTGRAFFVTRGRQSAKSC